MKVLVAGGTGFLGGAIARCAMRRKHDVTILSRGAKPADAIPGATYITADRVKDLSALKTLHFDLVADTCAFTPWHVTDLLDSLARPPSIYAFVSSINVYGAHPTPQMDETADTPRATPEHFEAARMIPEGAECNGASYSENYGPLKREAELAAIERLGDGALILRSGLLVGAGDYTDRLTYWVRRTDSGGEFAAPGTHDRLVQLIDVRDFAEFILHTAERSVGGVFNITGNPMPFGHVLEQCIAVAKSNAKPRWISDSKIAEKNIAMWTELPMWLPDAEKNFAHFLNTSIEKALSHGLAFRPLEKTLNNILDWDRTRRHVPLKCGLTPEREALLLN
jgi:2'-hydroxyisoflavone reductase